MATRDLKFPKTVNLTTVEAFDLLWLLCQPEGTNEWKVSQAKRVLVRVVREAILCPPKK